MKSKIKVSAGQLLTSTVYLRVYEVQELYSDAKGAQTARLLILDADANDLIDTFRQISVSHLEYGLSIGTLTSSL